VCVCVCMCACACVCVCVCACVCARAHRANSSRLRPGEGRQVLLSIRSLSPLYLRNAFFCFVKSFILT